MRSKLSVALCVALLAGCSDKQAAEQSKNHRQFLAAVGGYEKAQQGFVPKGEEATGADGKPSPELAPYRSKTLLQAAKGLEATLTSASEADKLQARRLIADAYATAAEQSAREAMADWVDVSRRSASLVSQVLLADRADARAKAFDIDETPLIEKLKEQQKLAAQEADEFQKTAQTLAGRGKKLEQVIAKARGEADSAVDQVSKLRTEAFVKRGAGQDALLARAVRLEGDAAGARAVVQSQGAELDVVRSELAVVNQQIALRQANIKSLQDQIAGVEQRQRKNHDERDGAVTQKERAVAELKEALEKIGADYATLVEAKMVTAQAHADKAIAALGEAAKKASGADKKAVQLDLLSKHAVRAAVNAQNLFAASGYSKTIDVLANQIKRLMPSVTTFADAQTKMAEAVAKASTLAREAVNQGVGLATELKQAGDDPNVEIAFQAIQASSKNVEDSTGSPAPTAAPTPEPAPQPQ